ncbi:hypothetical protein [Nitrospira sp. Nam74]
MSPYLFRSRHTGNPGLLIGTRAICRYGRISTATFYDWMRNHGLPAAKLPDGRWVTSKVLIDDWVLGLWRSQYGASSEDVAAQQTLGNIGVPEARFNRDTASSCDAQHSTVQPNRREE